MVIELFDKKGKKLAAILNFVRNYGPNPIFSEQIFYHFIFILRPLRKIYLWLVPNFVYVHLFNNRTMRYTVQMREFGGNSNSTAFAQRSSI